MLYSVIIMYVIFNVPVTIWIISIFLMLCWFIFLPNMINYLIFSFCQDCGFDALIMKFRWSLQTYMFLEGVHICSNKFDEKAQRALMFSEGVQICSNEFDEKVKSSNMFLSGVACTFIFNKILVIELHFIWWIVFYLISNFVYIIYVLDLLLNF